MTIKLKRIAAGYYSTSDGKYEVSKRENGEWQWNRAGAPPDDIYRTKRDAIAALAERIGRDAHA